MTKRVQFILKMSKKSNLIELESSEERNLSTYLINKLGKLNLVYDKVNRAYKINYDALVKFFPYNNLILNFKNKELTIKSLILYFSEALEYNNSESKTGTINIMLPMIYATYNVKYFSKNVMFENYKNKIYNYKIYNNYDWLNIDESIKKNIEPKKLSIRICDMVYKNVTETFEELSVYFEVDFKDKTKKKYDIGIALNNNSEETEFVIMIEIQEDTNIHNKNINDKKKEEMRGNGSRQGAHGFE